MKHTWQRGKIDGKYDAVLCSRCELIVAAIPGFQGMKKGDSVYLPAYHVIVYSESSLTEKSIDMLVKKHNIDCG